MFINDFTSKNGCVIYVGINVINKFKNNSIDKMKKDKCFWDIKTKIIFKNKINCLNSMADTLYREFEIGLKGSKKEYWFPGWHQIDCDPLKNT